MAFPRALRPSQGTRAPWGPCPAQPDAIRALPKTRGAQGIPQALPLRRFPHVPSLPGSSAPLRLAPPVFLRALGRARGPPCPLLRPKIGAGGARAAAAPLQLPSGARGVPWLPPVPLRPWGWAHGAQGGPGPLRKPSRAGGAPELFGVSAALLGVPGEPLALGDREQRVLLGWKIHSGGTAGREIRWDEGWLGHNKRHCSHRTPMRRGSLQRGETSQIGEKKVAGTSSQDSPPWAGWGWTAGDLGGLCWVAAGSSHPASPRGPPPAPGKPPASPISCGHEEPGSSPAHPQLGTPRSLLGIPQKPPHSLLTCARSRISSPPPPGRG